MTSGMNRRTPCLPAALADPEPVAEREDWSAGRADVEEWAGAHGYVTSCDLRDGLWSVAVVGTSYDVLGDADEHAAWADLAELIDARESDLHAFEGDLPWEVQDDAR